jgi:hypothetical protein
LATPATAGVSTHQFTIVNGIPGAKVDICVDGKEIKSRVPYGGKKFYLKYNDDKVFVRFHPAKPGKCKGAPLAAKTIHLDGGDDDLTVVATKKAPKVLIFDNDGLGGLPAADPAPVAIRHAADFGKITFRLRTFVSQGEEGPLTPTFGDNYYRKGQQFTEVGDAGLFIRIRATRPNKFKTLVGPSYADLLAFKRLEIILVGTTPANARFVIFHRGIGGS